MKIFDISFSPTGGTAKVSQIIANGIKKEKVCVDLAAPDIDPVSLKICENDTAVISVPSYGGRVPITAVDRISKLKGMNIEGTPIHWSVDEKNFCFWLE